MNPFKYIGRWFGKLGEVFAREFSIVTHDAGAMLFFIGLPLLYPIVYTLIYNPEVVRQLPVAVVDNSRTPESRELVRAASAAPAVQIFSYDANLADAKARMASGDVFAIMEIPSDYAKKLASGEQATVPMYFDMSLLLRYRALLGAMTDLQMKVMQDVTAARVETIGASGSGMTSLPVKSESNFMGDTSDGFASFVIPGIVILILQQSMVLGVMLIEGSSRERRRRNGGIDPKMTDNAPASSLVLGKALCYTVIYIPMALYILALIPRFFNLPHIGEPSDYLLFIFPLLLASAFFGQTLSFFAKERESTFMIAVFTSVVFLFLSGLTWPRYAMSDFWRFCGDLVPGVWGIEGFIRINSNAATLSESARPFLAMWGLAALYFITAWIVMAYIRKESRTRRVPADTPNTDGPSVQEAR
ncbi:MAG: ABC transporter permease [Muribaculaceae bacterium]|nr:ABC transporter permease [Muribaculaceae bacterium]